MTEQELINKGRAKGYDDTLISRLVNEAREKGIIQEDEIEQQKPSEDGRSFFDVLYTKEANRMPASGVGGHLKKGALDLIGALSLPARALGAAQGIGPIEEARTNIGAPTAEWARSKNIPVVSGLAEMVATGLGDPMTYTGAGIGRNIARGMSKTLPTKTAAMEAMPTIQQEAKQTLPDMIKNPTVADELVPGAAPKKTLKQKLTFQMPDVDRSILHEKLEPGNKPFTYYSKVQRAAIKNPRNPTAMDIASREATDALTEIKKKMNEVGAKKGEILSAKGDISIDVSDVRRKFNQLVNDRLGGRFDADGKLFAPEGRMIRDENSVALAEDINRTLGNFNAASATQLDDLAARLRSLETKQKVSQAKPINTIAEGIGKEIRGDIKKKLNSTLGKEYSTLNEEYAELAQTNKWLNGKLGEIVDTKTGQARMGASLLKSSVQSNSDRGTKAMFEKIKKITGKDLIRDAKYAEIAMKATKDQRALNLLEEVQKTNMGLKELLMKPIEKTIGKYLDYPEIDAIDKYYLKYQTGGK